MERNDYLKLCQKTAMKFTRPDWKKAEVDSEYIVHLGGRPYIAYGYEMTFSETGYPNHTAILEDIKSDTLVYVNVGKVDYNG